MYRNFYIYPVCAVCFLVGLLIYFVARAKLFRNEEIFIHTPNFDEQNVMQKHQLIWLRLGYLTFLPLVFMILESILDKHLSDEAYQIYHAIAMQPLIPLALYFIVMTTNILYPHNVFSDTSHVISRYMAHPSPLVFSMVISLLSAAITAPLGTAVYIICSGDVGNVGLLGKDAALLLQFAADFLLMFLANYSIIRYFYDTPRELVLKETTEDNYDAVAKRYYGMWRNRLIAANLVVGAQLILGGLVTLTDGMEHLMGIRILGLVILVIVFIYILIQSRSFDDPVVVNGMVYPSEKKRVMTKWVIGIAIIVYILGAIILL